MMKYQDARGLFGNGDIVFFSGGQKNIVRRLITWFSKGRYYHVGIAFWADIEGIGKKLMLAEAQPDGFRIINLGAYQDRNMTVIRTDARWNDLAVATVSSAGEVKYDFADLVAIGLHERFGVPLPKKSRAGYVCSAIVSHILSLAGVSEIESTVSPQKLFRQLANKYGTILSVET